MTDIRIRDLQITELGESLHCMHDVLPMVITLKRPWALNKQNIKTNQLFWSSLYMLVEGILPCAHMSCAWI